MGPSDENSSDLLDFERLIAEYGDRIYGAALRITGSTSDAEDVLQDTFLQAYEHRASFRGESSPATWLYRIGINAALQRVRGQRPVAYLDETGIDESRVVDWSPHLSSGAEAGELRREIERALVRLPEDARVTVVLRDIEGLTTGETAAVLGITEAAVKSRLHRGRLLLRQFLSGYLQSR
jgi:RNA polymerase sigma-70 factor (ECF subfamily)